MQNCLTRQKTAKYAAQWDPLMPTLIGPQEMDRAVREAGDPAQQRAAALFSASARSGALHHYDILRQHVMRGRSHAEMADRRRRIERRMRSLPLRGSDLAVSASRRIGAQLSSARSGRSTGRP